jgi:hypothetical protein
MSRANIDLYSLIHMSQHDPKPTREHELPPLIKRCLKGTHATKFIKFKRDIENKLIV